ncbi:MAG: hypothetical protein IPM29_03585 [Planctomycetes bacterium]|nr:hypothetical protein [Planctomycetota bacterium]
MRWFVITGVLLAAGLAAIVIRHEAGSDATGAPTAAVSSATVATISRGERVDLAPHVRDGTTVVEFTADW